MMDDVKDYPPYLDSPKERKKQTNADRIRQMTDEELAEAFERSCPNDSGNRCCTYFAKGSNGCFNCWIDWLKQEVSE